MFELRRQPASAANASNVNSVLNWNLWVNFDASLQLRQSEHFKIQYISITLDITTREKSQTMYQRKMKESRLLKLQPMDFQKVNRCFQSTYQNVLLFRTLLNWKFATKFKTFLFWDLWKSVYCQLRTGMILSRKL